MPSGAVYLFNFATEDSNPIHNALELPSKQSSLDLQLTNACDPVQQRVECQCVKRVKFSHTRFRASGPAGADPSVQAVSPQVTLRHPPSGRLPLLSDRPVRLPSQLKSVTANRPVLNYTDGDRGTCM